MAIEAGAEPEPDAEVEGKDVNATLVVPSVIVARVEAGAATRRIESFMAV